jgi:hypothetical protein
MLLPVVAALLAGTISVVPANGSPAAEAIADELARLGALARGMADAFARRATEALRHCP